MKALTNKKPPVNRLNTESNGIVALFVIIIALMLSVRDIGGLSINKYIFLGICIVFMTISSFQNLCYMICFLIPLFNGLPGTYIRLAAIILIIAKSKWKIQGKVFGFIAFFAFLEFFASIWYPHSDIIQIVSYITTLALLFFLIYSKEEFNYERCIEYFVLGSCVFCIIVIASGIMSSRYNWIDMISNVQLRFGESEEEGMHITANANALGYYCMAGCSSAFYLAKNAESPLFSKTLHLGLSIFIAITGFLSLSRSYVLVFLIIVFLYVLMEGSNIRKIFGTIAATIAVAFGVYLLIKYNSVAAGVWNGLVIRFNRSDIISGNGRTDAFLMFNEAFIQNLRFILSGTGVTQYKNVIGVSGAIHNMFQQIVICYGFLGATVFLFSIFKPAIKLFRQRMIPLTDYLPLLGIVLFAQTIQFINPYQYMLVYAMGIFVLGNSATRGNKA